MIAVGCSFGSSLWKRDIPRFYSLSHIVSRKLPVRPVYPCLFKNTCFSKKGMISHAAFSDRTIIDHILASSISQDGDGSDSEVRSGCGVQRGGREAGTWRYQRANPSSICKPRLKDTHTTPQPSAAWRDSASSAHQPPIFVPPSSLLFLSCLA